MVAFFITLSLNVFVVEWMKWWTKQVSVWEGVLFSRCCSRFSFVSFEQNVLFEKSTKGRRSHKELELKEIEFDIQTVSELIDDSDDDDDNVDNHDERLKRRAHKRKGKLITKSHDMGLASSSTSSFNSPIN